MLSPDQSRLATSVLDPAVNTRDVWTYDVARGIRTRLTFEPSDDFAPTWSPDGKELIFSSHRAGGSITLFRRPSEASGQEQPVVADSLGLGKFATHWSRDGEYLLYIGGGGIIAGATSGSPCFRETRPPFRSGNGVRRESRPLLAGRPLDRVHVARRGRSEVFVRPFRRPGPPQRISNGGGGWPRWRRDGKEIVYLSLDNKLMSVPVNGEGASFSRRRRVRSLRCSSGRSRGWTRTRTTCRDAQRFLLNGFVEAAPTTASRCS